MPSSDSSKIDKPVLVPSIPEEQVKATKPFTSRNASHQSDSRITRLSHVILQSTFTGAMYGALISIPTELLLRWRSPFYRSFGTRIRVFYHTIIITYSAAFLTEHNVRLFEETVRKEEEDRRKQLIEWSVQNGIYTGGEEGFSTDATPKK